MPQNTTIIKTAISPELFQQRCVHVIDLCGVKTTSGPLWCEIGDSICSRLESIFRARLPASCTFEKATETRYVIVTPASNLEEGIAFAFRIASELLVALYGRCDLDQMYIETAASDGPNRIRSRRVRGEQLAALAKLNFDAGAHPADAGANNRGHKFGTPQHLQDLQVTHHFEPVWDAKHEVVSTYICTPGVITSASTAGTVLQLKDLHPAERATVELSCLKAGVGNLSRCLVTGDRFLLGIPISFETLCTPGGRMEFNGTCRGLPAMYRRYIMFLLADVPLGVTQSRLAELATTLRPFGHVVASVASGCRNFSAYDGNSFSALALDLATDCGDTARRYADILHVGRAGRGNRLGPMIFNVPDAQTLTAAAAADFQFMHGPAVTTPVQRPRRMSWLPTTEVLPMAANGGSEDWF